MIVNCARGEIVDLDALAEALEAGRIAGAALDVYPAEPLPADAAIRRAPRTVLTPHIAGSTVEAQQNVALDVARQVLDVLAGRPPRDAVNAPRPPSEEAGGERWVRLAERLGSLAAQLIAERPEAMALTYRGALLDLEPEPLRAAAAKGVLETFSEERVNLVNAMSVAQARGLAIVERRETEESRYPALLELALGGTSVGGTLVQGEPRIARARRPGGHAPRRERREHLFDAGRPAAPARGCAHDPHARRPGAGHRARSDRHVRRRR